MNSLRSVRQASVLALGGLLLLAACGVPKQENPEPLPAGALPGPVASTPAAAPSADVVQRGLWFTREDGLVPVALRLPRPVSADDVLEALVTGPSQAELGSGLRTIARDPLTGQAMISLLEAEPRDATNSSPRVAKVSVNSAFNALPPADQLLLLGQVVLSLSDAGWQRVQFLDEVGSELSVPLPNGRVLVGNAEASDFRTLVL